MSWSVFGRCSNESEHLLDYVDQECEDPEKQQKGARSPQLMMWNLIFVIQAKDMKIVDFIFPEDPDAKTSGKNNIYDQESKPKYRVWCLDTSPEQFFSLSIIYTIFGTLVENILT